MFHNSNVFYFNNPFHFVSLTVLKYFLGVIETISINDTGNSSHDQSSYRVSKYSYKCSRQS